MEQKYQNINVQHIIQALTVIHQSAATAQQIRVANVFLAQAQATPKFAEALLVIYSHAENPQLQLSSLLLLTNVIKRNWNNNKRSSRSAQSMGLSETDKEELRMLILSAYALHDMKHYKHFNHLLRYLTRTDFPLRYPQLHNFVLNSLKQLVQLMQKDVNGLINSSRVMAVLSTCKAVLKEYNLKKVSHNQETFLQYITDIIKESVTLSQQMHAYMKPWLESRAFMPVARLLECLRKVDKVAVYGLGSMPSLYQYNSEISQIVAVVVSHITCFDQLLVQYIDQKPIEVTDELQKYNVGLLEQVSRLQVSYPFLFGAFLSEYLLMLINMLVNNLPNNKVYSSQKLMSVIVAANYKPLNTFAYNLSPQEFKTTIYSRKNSEIDNIQLQKQCSQSFLKIYSPETVSKLLQTLLTQVMTASHVAYNQRQLHQQLVLQDIQIAIVDQVSEPTVYQNCVTLCKNLVKCFKNEVKRLVVDLVRSVPVLSQQRDAHSRQVIQNIMELILVIPHIYDSAELPIQQICSILEVLYNAQQFTYLARIIRKYHSHLSQTTILNAFTILARIAASPVSANISPQIIYQCALGLKTILMEIEGAVLPMELLGGCITNIVGIMTLPQFTSNPTLTWPIINLLVKFIKSISEAALVQQAGYIIVKGLSPMIQSSQNEELIVCAFAQLMATLVHVCLQPIKLEFLVRGKPFEPHPRMATVTNNSLVLLEGAQILIQRNIKNLSLENFDNIYRLWLSLSRHYPTIYQQQVYGFELSTLNSSMLNLFQNHHLQLLEDDPVIFVGIIEEYFLIGLMPLGQNEILEIFTNCLSSNLQEEKRYRIFKALASLYMSFAILRAPSQQILLLLFNELIHLKNKISPQVNALRTFLFLVIDWHILRQNAAETFTLFTSAHNNNFRQWLEPFFWSMQFVSNKFAFKLNSAIIVKAILDIGAQNFATIMTTPAQGQLPIDWILRVIAVELEAVRRNFMINSYNNIEKTLLPDQMCPDFVESSYRKTRLQVGDPLIDQLVDVNLRSQCGQKLLSVMKCLDWSREDLSEHVGTACLNQLCDLLRWPRKTE